MTLGCTTALQGISLASTANEATVVHEATTAPQTTQNRSVDRLQNGQFITTPSIQMSLKSKVSGLPLLRLLDSN